MDAQFRETEHERNQRLRKKRLAKAQRPHYDDWDEYCELEQQLINDDALVGQWTIEDL